MTVAGIAATTFSGSIGDSGGAGSGSGGGLTVNGLGNLTLTSSNSYSGPTTIGGGTLQLGTGQSGQDGSIAATSGVTDNATLVYALAGSQTVGYPIGGSGSLLKTGAGTMVVQSRNSYTGPTVIGGGVLQLGSVAPQLAYNFSSGSAVNTGNNASTVTTTPVGSPVFSATGGPNGQGVMGLNGSNYLNIQAASLPNLSGSANYTIGVWINTTEAGASLLYKGDGGWDSKDEVFYLGNEASGATQGSPGSGGTDAAGGYVAGVQYAGGWVGSTPNVDSGSWVYVTYIRSGGTTTCYVNGQADGTSSGMSLNEQGTQDIRIGSNGGSHDGALMFSGSISGACVYGTALNAAQVQLLYSAGPASVHGLLPSATALSITGSGAALDLNGIPQTVASLSGVAGSRVCLGGGTLTVAGSGSTTFAGNISDAGGASSGTGGSLVMNGPGSLALAGVNNFTGPTIVCGGVLAAGAVNTLSPNSAVVVTGGTLDASSFAETIKSLAIGSLGSLNLGTGNLLTSTGTDALSGTLDVLHFSGGSAELMAYSSESGAFGAVTGLPNGFGLLYKPTQLDVVCTLAPTSFSLAAAINPQRIMLGSTATLTGSITNSGSAGCDAMNCTLAAAVASGSGSLTALNNSSGAALALGAARRPAPRSRPRRAGWRP